MNFLKTTDELLRGRFTKAEDLRDGSVKVPSRRLAITSLVLGLVYGIFMALYAVMRPANASLMPLFATSIKVPLLFLATLAVTFPSLYVFSALAGSRLRGEATLRLLLVAITVNLALLASLAPITAFFTFSTTSYAFMVLLNVLFFGLAGFVGLNFLARSLGYVFEFEDLAEHTEGKPKDATSVEAEHVESTESDQTANAEADPETSWEKASPDFEDAIRRRSPKARTVAKTVPAKPSNIQQRSQRIFQVWVIIYAVVGSQMAWILRPFIGDPRLPFEWFRERDSNFAAAVLEAIAELFS